MSPNRSALKFAYLLSLVILTQLGIGLAQESTLAGPSSRDTAPVEIASAAPMPEAPSAARTALPAAPAVAVPVAPVAFVHVAGPSISETRHPFWDNKNRVLFATVGALATVDFFATRSNLNRGGKELNPVTNLFAGSTPALATNFALEAGGVIGISYLFHKTGHHKLERATALVNIGTSGAAVAYSLSHR